MSHMDTSLRRGIHVRGSPETSLINAGGPVDNGFLISVFSNTLCVSSDAVSGGEKMVPGCS